MPFWRCNYHIVWTTKHRAPLITPEREPTIFRAIHLRSDDLGAEVLAVNAVSDHIHVAVSIPPSHAVAHWVKTVKGFSSRAVNENRPDHDNLFRWQSGYGALTFGERVKPIVLAYIENQKSHHAENQLQPYLECVAEVEN